jgi:hypothetical protein
MADEKAAKRVIFDFCNDVEEEDFGARLIQIAFSRTSQSLYVVCTVR